MRNTQEQMSYKDQIKEFLKSDEFYSLLIYGGWGVGKTYLWKEIENEINPKIIQKKDLWKKFKSNANFFNHLIILISIIKQYVGITLMSIIKYFNLCSYIENPNKQVKNIVYVSLFGKEHYKEVLEEITLKAYKHNKILYFIRNITFWKLSIGAFLQLFIEKNFENIIVCLDDLERKSDKLDIKDILGLVNKLKEEKCKVILIGDIDSLRQQQDIFKEYREKSIETKLHIESITEVAKQIIKEKCPKIQDSIIPYRELIKINNLRIIKKIAYIFNLFYEKLEFKTDLNNFETENIYKFILLEITKELNPKNFKSKDEFNDNLELREISNIIKKIINNYSKNTFTYIQKEDIEKIKKYIKKIVHHNTIISKIDKLFNIIKQIKEEKFKDNNIPEINQILENIKEIDEKYKIFINNFKPVDFFALVNYTDHTKKQSILNIKNAYIEEFTREEHPFYYQMLKKLINITEDNNLKTKQEEITERNKNKTTNNQANKKDNENILTQINNYNDLEYFIENRQIKTNDIKELKKNKLINFYIKFFFSYENNQIKYKELYEIYKN
nr:P-loop NTPase fold protein [Campylobacter lari]MCR6513220.1 P-loop NTPase fold protein [Campylobacter lari]